jgi:hypothetical protein
MVSVFSIKYDAILSANRFFVGLGSEVNECARNLIIEERRKNYLLFLEFESEHPSYNV